MTFIQPNKNRSPLSTLLATLVLILFCGAAYLVVLYNSYVNFTHEFAQSKSEFQSIQAANAELKESVFTIVNSLNFKTIAAQKNLVQDKKPEYLEVNQQWQYASDL